MSPEEIETRSYRQYCPVACALDVLGDRWTLLILRDLSLAGPRRFSDLRAGMPTIPPNLLSQRLRLLVREGLVTVEDLPPPAARSVYVLTGRGREAVPVLRALARFGVPLLPEPDGDAVLSPRMAIHALVVAWFDPVAAQGIDEHYELQVDDLTQILSTRVGAAAGAASGRRALTLHTDGRTLLNMRRGVMSIDEAVATLDLRVEGSRAALRRFQRVFAFPS